MYPVINKLYALNGDTWSAPASTLEAFWAALGAGADALTLSVFLTKDQVIICAPHENLLASCGVDKQVSALTYAELQEYDAGATFRSTQLDHDGQPTGEFGTDTPWQAVKTEWPLKDRKNLKHPSLKQVFERLSRQTKIHLQLPETNESILTALLPKLLETIDAFSLASHVTVLGSHSSLKQLRKLDPNLKVSLLCSDAISATDVNAACELNSQCISTFFELIQQLAESERAALFDFAHQNAIRWCFASNVMPFAPSTDTLSQLASYHCQIEAWQTKGVLPTRQQCESWPTLFEESFAGDTLDVDYWAAGYSHINQETLISVDNKLVISIQEGKAYSGGAAICLLPFHGDFDAEVCFHVANPHQATTFELAAIGIDPGYHHLKNDDLDTRKVNMTFDVHGAPPYASSERDQNDGFRCGWNNSYNFAKFGGVDKNEWEASSSNMYNKYGRDVGDGSTANLTGRLRLTRKGDLFTSYYQDKHNPDWVCSGTMLVQSLPNTAYLRLAAKHWHKIDPAPGNKVQFWDFKVRQPL